MKNMPLNGLLRCAERVHPFPQGNNPVRTAFVSELQGKHSNDRD
jgi:hypothetical protein